MRILTVSPYHEPAGGGLERYAHAMDRELVRRGHDVRALAFAPRAGDAVDGASVRDGVVLEQEAPLLRIGNTPIHPRFASAVRRAIVRHRPDVVVAHTPVPFPAEMAFRAAARLRVPFVTVYHAGQLRGSSRLLDAVAALDRATLERRMLDESAALVAVSDYVLRHALRRHAGKTTVIPPGVDLARWPLPARGAGDGFLFVAPLDQSYRWKGLDVLMAAFDEVRATHPSATLTLVGHGDRADEVRAWAARHQGAVRLPGRLADADLAAMYRRHAATLLPSTTDAESFGMVLAEANAAGRPVLGSDVGGIPCFVRDGVNGRLVPPGDAHALARAMRGILDAPAEAMAMGARGRDLVAREHAWPELAKRFEAVLLHAARPGQVPVAAPTP